MNCISSIFWIVKILSILIEIESLGDDIIEKFYWSPKNEDRDVQWEFSIIGRKVPWNIAKVMCTNRDSSHSSEMNLLDLEDILSYTNFSGIRKDTEFIRESKLAILKEDKLQIWLSRMLAESDYRYDGLWVGGHRINSNSNWTWIGMNESEEIVIPKSPIIANYPEWYKSDNYQEIEKNCLLFDRVGHNMPILLPSDCNQRKPFVCSRLVRKKIPERIVEGIGIYVDGYRYTVYSVDSNDDNDKEMENTSGIRKLNGGGVKWRDARVECRKRGKYLANVLSIEAAAGIASIMLKNRPSMESAWLGGWSTDGTEWTWSPTGFILSTTKSQTTQYPPWLAGHPLTSSNFNEFSGKKGRCLILDRHLCPDHINPVFLDLDCEKKRPFVCQDAMPRRNGLGNRATSINRSITMGNRVLKFSTDRMTWNEGRQYCANNFGRIASILDSKTLSAILDKMTDLYIDHIWVGGKTEKTSEGWRWFDETGKPLSRKGIGAGSSWCLGDNDDNWPKADADTCLNLDREGHGLPLFYGLRCDFAKQHILCSMDHGSRSLSIPTTDLERNETKIGNKKEEGKIFIGSRRSFRSGFNSTRSINEEKGLKIIEEKNSKKNRSDRYFDSFDKKDSSSNFETITTTLIYDSLKFFENDKRNKSISTIPSEDNKKLKKGMKIADLDEESKRLLIASGYNFTDTDTILGLEVELVDLNENSTIVSIKKEESI